MGRYSIDFVAVNYNSHDYSEILVRSIKKFVNADYNIYIVDNSNQVDKLQKIDSSLNVIKGNNDVEQGSAPSPQSAAHAASVQLGISVGSADYICICDILTYIIFIYKHVFRKMYRWVLTSFVIMSNFPAFQDCPSWPTCLSSLE